MWNKHNGLNQKWKILYLDEKDDEYARLIQDEPDEESEISIQK